MMIHSKTTESELCAIRSVKINIKGIKIINSFSTQSEGSSTLNFKRKFSFPDKNWITFVQNELLAAAFKQTLKTFLDWTA